MRNVESEPTRGGLHTRVLLVCDNKRKEAQYEVGRKKDQETSETKKTIEIQKEEEEARRMVSKRKRKARSAKNEVKRDQEDS